MSDLARLTPEVEKRLRKQMGFWDCACTDDQEAICLRCKVDAALTEIDALRSALERIDAAYGKLSAIEFANNALEIARTELERLKKRTQ